jgi:two-component system, chemotaxis family, chemotaxis protein CheY
VKPVWQQTLEANFMQLKALVLDDSGVMRTMLMNALTHLNFAEFEFTEAEDGVIGLEKFNADSFDIIFADWNMPNMSGIDFAHKVRGTRKGSETPIIMVTSEKTLGKLEEALNSAKVNAYISKPFTGDYLGRKLAPIIFSLGEKSPKPRGGFFGKLIGG